MRLKCKGGSFIFPECFETLAVKEGEEIEVSEEIGEMILRRHAKSFVNLDKPVAEEPVAGKKIRNSKDKMLPQDGMFDKDFG